MGIFFFFIFFFSLFFQDRRLKCVCVCVCLDASLTASVQPASFPIMRRRRQLRRMRYGGTGETLVSGRLRVDAQRHLAAHQLVHYEFVQFFCCFFFYLKEKERKRKKLISLFIHSLLFSGDFVLVSVWFSGTKSKREEILLRFRRIGERFCL